MNWVLNTLQLSAMNYLAILNKQRLPPPIDTIQHRNNLSFLKKYLTKYEVNNFTKSVNSVKTPLTQYQLYKYSRQTSYTKQNLLEKSTQEQTDSSDLYPGKRYLNLDLNFYNDSIFTHTIFNPPTPTDEIIPIIITADTPTASTDSVQEFEDTLKLRPLDANIIPIATTRTTITAKYLNKSAAPNINSIPRPTIVNDYHQDKTEITAAVDYDVLNEATSNKNSIITKPKSAVANTHFTQLSTTESDTKSFVEVNDTSLTTITAKYLTKTSYHDINSISRPKSVNDYQDKIKVSAVVDNELLNEATLTKSSIIEPNSSGYVKDLSEASGRRSSIEVNDTSNTTKTAKDLTEFPISDINSIPKPEIVKDCRDGTEVPAVAINAKSSTAIKDFSDLNIASDKKSLFQIHDNSGCIQLKSDIKSEDLLRDSLKILNNENNIQTNSSTLENEISVLQVTNHENYDNPTKYSFCNTSKDIPKPETTLNVSEESTVLKELNAETNILAKDYSLLKESDNRSNISAKYSKSNNHFPNTSNIVEEYSSAFEENNTEPKIFNSKFKDDSSSSDEFLESFRQPSNNSEGSSSASSSLELM